MKLNRNTIVNVGYAMSLALAGLAGCATDGSTPPDFFPADDAARRSRVFMSAETTAGAHENATLYAIDFDGGRLNSLGAEKLARLVPNSADSDVNVYVDVPKNEMASARQEDVMVYLRAAGVEAAHIKLHDGANAMAASPAADGLSRMSKVETGGASGTSSSEAAAPSGGGSTGSSMMAQ
jgi:hypothetical protein